VCVSCRFQTPDYISCCRTVNSMNNSKSQSNDIEERKEDDTVLAQMGEDPGLPADVIEHEDSKERNQNSKKTNERK
jgi:hypothetical protein